MTVRAFSDPAAVTWQVWEVIPGSPRISGPSTGQMPNVWGGAPRPDVAPPVSQGDGTGWLVFMAGAERRRLAPIPSGWADLDDAALIGLLEQAAG